MPHLGTAAAACVLLGTVVAAPTAVAAEPPMCDGRAATVVGGLNETVVGTDGDDVVVAVDSRLIDGRGGNDTICVDGTTRYFFDVLGGAGDDYIDVSGSTAMVIRADLGEGADVYRGAEHRDVVEADHEGPGSGDPDTVFTESGSDEVHSGQPGRGTADRLFLGVRGDSVILAGHPTRAAVLDGGPAGPGTDLMKLEGAGGSWTINARAGQIERGTLRGFDSFLLEDAGSVRFTGGDRPEQVTMYDDFPLAASMGGGDDVVSMTTAGSSDVRGQGGSDTLVFQNLQYWSPRVTVDLSANLIKTSRPAGRATVDVENVKVDGARWVRVTGDQQRNRLEVVWGCDIQMFGGRGDDVIDVQGHTCKIVPQLRGEAGHDRLRGGERHDLIVGGTGRDLADGRKGRDRCIAEIRRSCERSSARPELSDGPAHQSP